MQKRYMFLGLGMALIAGLMGCSAQNRPASGPIEKAAQSATALLWISNDPSATPTALPQAHATQDRPISVAQAELLTTATLVPTPAFMLCSPLASDPLADLSLIISDPYRPPPPHHDERHQGVDFSYYRRNGRTSIEGVEVQSVLGGKVAGAVQDSFPFGNMVMVETPFTDLPQALSEKLGMASGESLYALYAHMSNSPQVKVGDEVTPCQALGRVGKTGNAGVAHLHLETRLGPPGSTFTGMRYYDVNATQQEKDNYVLWSMSGVFRHFNPMDLLSWK